MAMTATQLGSIFNRSAAAMNLLLRDHGYLEGRPGAWRATELAKPFAHALGDGNEYGGYAHRSWSWLSWSDDIVDALKSSLEANPNGVATLTKAPITVAASATRPGTGSGAPGRGRNALLGVAVLGVVAVATPAARNVWTQKVRPAALRTWDRVSGHRPVESDPEAAEDSVGHPQGDHRPNGQIRDADTVKPGNESRAKYTRH
jgi:hypothetical protein